MIEKPAHYRLLDVIAAGLAANGYDGLTYPGVCGCKAGNLSPTGCLEFGCTPGYLHVHSKCPVVWVVSVSSAPLSDGEIDDLRTLEYRG